MAALVLFVDPKHAAMRPVRFFEYSKKILIDVLVFQTYNKRYKPRRCTRSSQTSQARASILR